MQREYFIWLCLAVYVCHVLEEIVYNWKAWANKSLGLPKDSAQLYLVNASVVLLGVSCGMIGWRVPAVALMFPALLVINAVFFHILPAIIQKKFSPGLFTSVFLLLPAGVGTYVVAAQEGQLYLWSFLSSVIGATAFVGFVMFLLKTQDRFSPKG
jgi:hypothetical protein